MSLDLHSIRKYMCVFALYTVCQILLVDDHFVLYV